MPKNEKLQALIDAHAVKVTGDVSPGLHPAALTPFAEPLVEHEAAKPALEAGLRGQRALYSAMVDMLAAHRATLEKYPGPGLVVDGRSIARQVDEAHAPQLAADLGTRFEGTARNLDNQLQTIEEVIGTLEVRIEKSLQHPKKDTASVAQAASDIRNYCRSLPDDKRLNWIHGAIRDGDIEVAAALLGSTPWVSGLNRESASVVRSLAEEQFAKADYDARAAAQKVAAHVRSSASNFTREYMKLVPTVKPSKLTATREQLKNGAAS